MLPRSYKPQDLLDLDEAVEVLARSSDPVERYLAAKVLERVNRSKTPPAAEISPPAQPPNGAVS